MKKNINHKKFMKLIKEEKKRMDAVKNVYPMERPMKFYSGEHPAGIEISKLSQQEPKLKDVLDKVDTIGKKIDELEMMYDSIKKLFAEMVKTRAQLNYMMSIVTALYTYSKIHTINDETARNIEESVETSRIALLSALETIK